MLYSLVLLLVCAVLLWLDNARYAGMLIQNDIWMYTLIIIAALNAFGFYERRAQKPVTRTQKIIAAAALGVSLIVIAGWTIRTFQQTRYRLEAWLFVVVLVWALLGMLPPLRKRAQAPGMVTAIALSLLLTTLVFLAVAQPITAQQTEQLMGLRGYTGMKRLYAPEWTPASVPSSPDEGAMGYYWFQAEYEQDTNRLVAVSMKTGTVVEEQW